jgi:hypothetical protein
MLRQRDYFCPSSTGFTINQIGEIIAACLTGRRRSRLATCEISARAGFDLLRGPSLQPLARNH